MKEFDEMKQKLESISAPADLEARLKAKLDAVPQKKKKPNIAKRCALTIVASLIIGFVSLNFQAIAFYGKTLIGYDELMTDSIKQLNEEGYGQPVEKKIQLHDGKTFVIEGIMSDLNQLELFYKVTGDGEDFSENFSFADLHGFWTKVDGSYGIFNPKTNRGILGFNPASPFAKKLTLTFTYKEKDYEITFPYKASQSVPTTLKKRINKSFKFGFGKVKIKKIIATKGTTRIEGEVKGKTDRSITYDLSQIILLADGKEIEGITSSINSSLFGKSEFDVTFQGIPEHTKELSIVVKKFNEKETVNKEIPLELKTFDLGPVDITILSIEKIDGQTAIRISTEYNVLLDKVQLKTSSGLVDLSQTSDFDTKSENQNIRTLYFKSEDDAQSLLIKNVYYIKNYDYTIPILK